MVSNSRISGSQLGHLGRPRGCASKRRSFSCNACDSEPTSDTSGSDAGARGEHHSTKHVFFLSGNDKTWGWVFRCGSKNYLLTMSKYKNAYSFCPSMSNCPIPPIFRPFSHGPRWFVAHHWWLYDRPRVIRDGGSSYWQVAWTKSAWCESVCACVFSYVYRDPYIGLLKSPYNWVVESPMQPKQPGVFSSPILCFPEFVGGWFDVFFF